MTQRKMFKIKMMLLLAAALLIGSTMHAQVTIGLDEAPAPGSLLQLKDKVNVTDGTFNAHKGMGLPRVQLSEKNQLYPMFLLNPDDPTSGPDANYQTNKNQLDKTHIGLLVYNLTEDEDKDLYPGLYQWDGKEWKSFEAKMGNAKFAQLTCGDIIVNGTYIEGTVVTAANYLTVNLDVAKVGAYSFTITSGNGYSFYLSGIALSAGPMTVNVPCQGKPIKAQTDKLTISGIDVVGTCQPEVNVASSVAKYSISCSSVSVNGIYIKGTSLDPGNNTITMTVTVSDVGSYSIEGSSTSGISFKATGVFYTVGSHTVTLAGTGKPAVNTDIPITIQSNSPEGNTFCSAVAKIILPAMTYAVIGNGDYSWNTTLRTSAFNGKSFGQSGKVKMASFSRLWEATSGADSGDAVNHMRETAKPDIILYFAYNAQPGTTLSALLAAYVKAGGVLIYGSADDDVTGSNNLLNGIFGPGAGTAVRISSNDDDYLINTLPNDPIINGPFGNLSGKFWGEDNGGSIYVRELPPNSVQICSANNQAENTNVSPDYSMVWYNENLNFVYFGDSPAASTNSTATDGWPVIYTDGLPVSKRYGAYSTSSANPYIFNSALEMNAVAWGIKKAASSGINPH
ncbi:hypothetical protein FACS1894123_05730 [Bacteroidia bacterium]|nr:hypothetical protein FACS1894123_05730 [Bacteroidia bacterium]